MTLTESILARLPYSAPFLFVDHIHEVSNEGISGGFYLDPDLDFYRGHFRQQPVTPGVILTEIMAQIGLACLGIYLSEENKAHNDFPFALTSSAVEYYLPVYPGETVTVKSTKIYYRFGKLKCKVALYNNAGALACEGTLAGMQIKPTVWKEE